MADRTVLVIAHRLATVRQADGFSCSTRAASSSGAATPSCSHAGGLYRRLYELQFRDDVEPAMPVTSGDMRA